MRAHGFVLGGVGDPNNLGWLADSMSLVSRMIERAHIDVYSIYVDGNITGIRSDHSLMCDPLAATITLNRYGKKRAMPCTGEQAISLSYLYSKDIFLKDRSRAYIV